MMASGRFDRLLIVYGIMADKALDEIIPLMPRDADYFFATPNTPRALPSADIASRFQAALDRTDRAVSVLSDAENALDRTDRAVLVLSDAENALDRTKRAVSVPSDAETANPSVKACGSVADAIREAQKNASENALIYIGGSTFVVSEAITYFETL
jgi:folylpolyglutamate synthase/dihydropteroate synthase